MAALRHIRPGEKPKGYKKWEMALEARGWSVKKTKMSAAFEAWCEFYADQYSGVRLAKALEARGWSVKKTKMSAGFEAWCAFYADQYSGVRLAKAIAPGTEPGTVAPAMASRGKAPRHGLFVDFLNLFSFEAIGKPAKAKPPGTRKQPWLGHQVEAAGGIKAFNSADAERAYLLRTMDAMCQATTPQQALVEVQAIMSLGHNLWAYAYMRMLYNKQPEVYYGTLLLLPQKLLPVVYTPTVGEACQKFGKMPQYERGCYVSIKDRGAIKATLSGYASKCMRAAAGGKYVVDCVVFSDGGRILGLGDLGTWGMGIPIGKLDLYTVRAAGVQLRSVGVRPECDQSGRIWIECGWSATHGGHRAQVCAGVDPYATIPVIIDAGCSGPTGNTDNLDIRDHHGYTGLREPRVTHASAAGPVVNSAYYGEGNMIEEVRALMASEGFGRPTIAFRHHASGDLIEELAPPFLPRSLTPRHVSAPRTHRTVHDRGHRALRDAAWRTAAATVRGLQLERRVPAPRDLSQQVPHVQ